MKTKQQDTLKLIDWKKIQDYYDNELKTLDDITKDFNINLNILKLASKQGLLKTQEANEKRNKRIKAGLTKPTFLSKEAREKISNSRKKYLKENPDKHHWRNKDKFKSVPCEKLKEFLKKKEIGFQEEFRDLQWDRFYSIDVAILDRKIALEVNGMQHYNQDGSLKPYYKEREDYLKSHGWIVIQIPYNKCFNDEDLNKIISDQFCGVEQSQEYIKSLILFSLRNKKAQLKAMCDKCLRIVKKPLRIIIKKTPRVKQVKEKKEHLKIVIGPQKEELEMLLKQNSFEQIGRKFGVSGNAVKKWAKKFSIYNRRQKHHFSGQRPSIEWIQQELLTMSKKELSKKIGIDYSTLRGWIKSANTKN